MKVTVIYLCLIVFIVIAIEEDAAGDDSDTVVIESAGPSNERSSRQVILRGPAVPLYNPFILPQGWSTVNNNALNIAANGQCFTAKGVFGKCTSFRQCYPYFKKLSTFESWMSEMYDTCTYYTIQGRQMYGVCCPKPSAPTETSPISSVDVPMVEPADETDSNSTSPNETAKIPYYPQISNWPPPLPTHPPDHTIPPLPTHPPSPGYPTHPPTPGYPTHPPTPGYPTHPPSVWPPTSTPWAPSWPPTSAPSIKPPTTTRPPWAPTAAPIDKPVLPTGACGAKNGYQDQERIVGGHSADPNEWPWIAALFNSGRQFCGGSLIDNIHILSAAHCVAHMSSWDVTRLTVRLGDHNIRTNSEVRHVEKKVKRVVRHRGFDSRTLYNDIAILTLDSPVEFTQQVRAVCLPNGGSDFSGKTGTVIGWGSLREMGPQPAVLQEVSIPIWNNRECKQKYGPAAPGGIVEHMLCAGQANRDSCSGDSGGPLMINSGKWTQVGIVSWGIGCGKGQYPGVYTRVEKFLPWINKNLK